MVDKQKDRLEKALGDVLEDVDKFYLRRLQAEMHRCATKCCENTADSIEQNYRCVEKCSIKSEQAEEYVVTEFLTFLNQLQKCADNCNDDIINKMGLKTPPKKKTDKYQKEVETCVVRCVEKHISIIPEFAKRLKEELGK